MMAEIIFLSGGSSVWLEICFQGSLQMGLDTRELCLSFGSSGEVAGQSWFGLLALVCEGQL